MPDLLVGDLRDGLEGVPVAPLKAPFPYFGGKTKAAALVWARLGPVPSYIEPFAGSLAVLLRRPFPPARYETCSDLYCMIPNFWRAMQADPAAVVAAADRPVFECDLTAIHRWLQTKERKEEFKSRMLCDKDFFDPEVAGLWAWGASCWIGAGWCDDNGVWYGEGDERNKGRGMHGADGTPEMEVSSETRGTRITEKRPCCRRPGGVQGLDVQRATVQQAIRAAREGTRPDLASESKGVCGQHAPHEKRPCLGDGHDTKGCVQFTAVKEGRPHLQRPYQLCSPSEKMPRGGHGTGTGVLRQGANLLPWFLALQARLRYVRVCCGDWQRIMGRSVLEAASPCGVFLDPPYSLEAGRDPGIYQTEDLGVAHRVRAWCLEHGGNRKLRICLAGYAGEGHEELEAHGWAVQAWKASGGYSRIHGEDKSAGLSNRHKERLWFSPGCQPADDAPLFAQGRQEGETE